MAVLSSSSSVRRGLAIAAKRPRSAVLAVSRNGEGHTGLNKKGQRILVTAQNAVKESTTQGVE